MRRNLLVMAAALAAFAMVAIACEHAAAEGRVFGGGTAGLSHWGTLRPVHPIEPIRPINPIRPIRPIYPWNPYWRNNVVLYPQYSYLYPNYYYPPSRWDSPAWDGQARNTEPQPQPKPQRPPEKPLVMQWNAAKGKAEVVDLNRWDNTKQPQQTADTTQKDEPVVSSEGTENLNRWDDSLP